MHKLLTKQSEQKILLIGNEAIARGAIEAGVAFASTYPGTPSSEISLNLFQISKESDLYFEYSCNEKVALEVASAAANTGLRSMCIMKHVGLNVAADVLMTLAYVGVKKGLVIVSADDPYMFSSQNEQDNRYYAKLSGLTILEPSSIQEAKDMTKDAFDLSETLNEPVILRTTTRINHSTAAVILGNIEKSIIKGRFVKDPFNYVTVPAVSRNLHIKLLKNIEKAQELSNFSKYNFISGDKKNLFGIICNGVSYNYVIDALNDLKAVNKIKILRIGFSYPMPENIIKDFLYECNKVLIIEEGEPYMEESVRAIAQKNKFTMDIMGKDDNLFSRLFEFEPALVRQNIAKYFDISYESPLKLDLSDLPEIPQRPPTLCAGCSHRATFYEIKKAAEGLDTIYPTDIGCYTLGFLPPLSMGDFLICMGSSIGTSCGFSKATDQKVISFIGDSTFFHAGIPGLINAVFNNHNLTLVILDNGTTAMTGHQPHPGVDMKKLNFDGYKQICIEDIVKAIGVSHTVVIEPFKVKKSIESIKEAISVKGVSVIISKEMCTLYAKNFKQANKKPFFVSDKCKNHRICIKELGCPAFFIENEKVKINPLLCTGCSVCAQICPDNAIFRTKEDK